MIRFILEKIIKTIIFLFTILISAPFILTFAIINILKNVLEYITYRYMCNKKFNEKKVKKKLYKKLKRILHIKKEINICKEFWIPIDEYESYTTLKYLFTENKNSFVYKKGCDKYLYNFYDMNAYKEDFIEKWIDEIKKMFSSEDYVKIEDITISNPIDDTKSRDVVRVSIK